MKYQAASALAVLLTVTAPVAAQDVFTLNPIIFSAGLTPTEALRTGVSVETVTAEEIEAAGDVQLSDFLATLPGITVSQTGPLGTNATLRIRGLNGNYIPVLINGIDVTDPASTQTSFNFGTLTTGGIDRIEVLYGSQSAIYGSEAIAGVINITTLQPPEDIGSETTVSVEAGSYDSFSSTVGYAENFGGARLSFTATRVITDGFSAAEENVGNTEEDGFDVTTLTLTGEVDVTDSLTVGVSLLAQSGTSEFDNSAGAGGDGDRFLETERTAARVFAEIDGGSIDHEVALQYSLTDRADPNSPSSPSDFEGTRYGVSYIGTIDLGGERRLGVAVEHVVEEYLAFGTTSRNEGDYSISSLTGDYNTPLNASTDLNASLRYDYNSEFGGGVSGRLASSWRVSDTTLIRAALATGFRAPSLNELFGPFGANPDLEPERSRSLELSIERDFGMARASAALFYTEIDDLIEFSGGGYNQVPGTSVSQGIEISGEFDVTETLQAFGSYTYTDARRRDDTRLVRVPYHNLVLGVSGEITPSMSFDVRGRGAMDTAVSSFATNPLDDYFVIDTSVSFALSEEAEVYFRIENLFDDEYQTTPGYGTSDRAIFAGVRATF